MTEKNVDKLWTFCPHALTSKHAICGHCGHVDMWTKFVCARDPLQSLPSKNTPTCIYRITNYFYQSYKGKQKETPPTDVHMYTCTHFSAAQTTAAANEGMQ